MGKVYACSDIHGNGALWDTIKKILNEDDILYYLGDSTDRGPDGWRILKEMIADKRIKYIAGNHDIMLANRIGNPYNYRIAGIHHSNGGSPTWDAAENDPESNDVKIAIRRMPLYAIYTNKNNKVIFMSHSGSTSIDNPEELIWDRTEYLSKSKTCEDYDYVVHGHTTIPHLIQDLKFFYEDIPINWESGAFWYHNGTRCDIDCYTIKTNRTVLLNLDTFEETIIF